MTVPRRAIGLQQDSPAQTPPGEGMIVSLGYRTDLAVLRAGGSRVVDHGDHLEITTTANPTFRWGNFLLLHRVPARQEVPRWICRAERAFPGLGHLAVGFDVEHGVSTDLADWAAVGFAVHQYSVLVSHALSSVPPGSAGSGGPVAHRPLTTDEDWARSVELEMVDLKGDPVDGRAFVRAKVEVDRRICTSGRGTWWGAFDGDDLVAQMGLITVPGGAARFQDVQTHPAHRRRGIARGLLGHVGRTALTAAGCDTLVVVADPGDLVLGLYTSMGFSTVQTQLGAVRAAR